MGVAPYTGSLVNLYGDDTLFFVSPHNKFFRSLFFYTFALTRLPPLSSHSKIYVRNESRKKTFIPSHSYIYIYYLGKNHIIR